MARVNILNISKTQEKEIVRMKTVRQLLACYEGVQKTPAADSRYIRPNY